MVEGNVSPFRSNAGPPPAGSLPGTPKFDLSLVLQATTAPLLNFCFCLLKAYLLIFSIY